ncbi:hypothetical protein [Gordonia westfalica]|uniref:Mce-associated membrane protein n=1 Tax=Gordonia westfalica TaxID=158898 RepID=A0A1H2KML1_9ACTN|nr:hypothetical protein [Gordonia westfalica]SDU69596.1 hypothetical protein SAMN04488548_1343405 [Gordonia westfalica]
MSQHDDTAAGTDHAEGTSAVTASSAVALDEAKPKKNKSEKDKAGKKSASAKNKSAQNGKKKSGKGKSGKKSEAAPVTRRPLIAVSAVAAIAVVLAAVFGILWATDGSADELAAVNTKIATDAEAEKVAGDYALNVSKVDYQDIDAWRTALETGVTQQLKEMSTAVDVVAPLLTQMQYVSTAEKLAATVAHSDGNQYVVRVFVDMDSKSRQTPDGVTATASYTITLDKASGWTITDVGGLGAGLPGQPGN